MSIRASIMQGHQAAFIFRVDVRSVLQEVLDHSHLVVTGGKMQGGRQAPLQVTAVHVLSRAELLHSLKVARFGGLQKLRKDNRFQKKCLFSFLRSILQ